MEECTRRMSRVTAEDMGIAQILAAVRATDDQRIRWAWLGCELHQYISNLAHVVALELWNVV